MPVLFRSRPHLAPLLTALVLAVAPIASGAPSASAAQPAAAIDARAGAAARQPADPHRSAAHSAGQWLAGQLVDGGVPGFVGTDWGLTIDVLIALRVTGADPAAAAEITDALAANVDAYATGADFAPDLRFGGATAKLLYAAAAAGADPTDFGGHDLRARTLDLVAGPAAGQEHGWIKDGDASGLTDGGDMFDQTLAVLGLARSGGVPQAVVDFLIGQQCPDGGFRLFPPEDGAACAAADPAAQVMDPDTTGMAVLALLAAEAAGAGATTDPVDRAVAWLRSVQRSSGAFHGSALTDFPNTNSTGLAGLALAAAGDGAAVDRAADWIAARQLTAGNAGAAATHAGAVAYTPDDFTQATSGGIPDFGLDQWRRSTAQAVLSLAKIPLGEAGATAPPSPGPTTGPTTSPTPTSPAPTSPGTAGPGAGGGLPVTGLPVAILVITGGAGLAAGALLLGFSARRRRQP